MFVLYECLLLSGRGLFDRSIPRTEESYRMWYVSLSVIGCNSSLQRVGRRTSEEEEEEEEEERKNYLYVLDIYCSVHRNILWNNQLVRARLRWEEVTETIWDRL